MKRWVGSIVLVFMLCACATNAQYFANPNLPETTEELQALITKYPINVTCAANTKVEVEFCAAWEMMLKGLGQHGPEDGDPHFTASLMMDHNKKFIAYSLDIGFMWPRALQGVQMEVYDSVVLLEVNEEGGAKALALFTMMIYSTVDTWSGQNLDKLIEIVDELRCTESKSVSYGR